MRLSLSLTALLVGLAVLSGVPPPDPPAVPIPRGVSWKRFLRAGETDRFAVHLAAGDHVRIAVEQQGLDVAVALLDPAGVGRIEADSPNGAEGWEVLHAVASAEGIHRIEVRPLDPRGSGRYTIRVDEVRPATAGDRLRAQAAEKLYQGELAYVEGSGTSLRQARQAYREAAQALRAVGDRSAEVWALRRLGQVSSALSDIPAARLSFERALELCRAGGNDAGRSLLLNDLGVTWRRLGVPGRAEEAYRESLALARSRRDVRGEATALNNLGVLEDARGRPLQAIRLYEEALAVWHRLGDRARTAGILYNLGVVYSHRGSLPEALDALNESLELRRAAGDRQAEASTLLEIAWVQTLEGESVKALALYDVALRAAREAGDLRGEAGALDRQGTALRKLGRNAEARASYLRALAIFQRIGDQVSEAHTRTNLGGLELARGDPEEARRLLAEALAIFRHAGERAGESQALLGLARVERRQGELEPAALHAESALRLVEELRREARIETLRTSYFAFQQDLYELAVELRMQLHERNPAAGFAARALEIHERAIARTLLESLGNPPSAAVGEPGAALSHRLNQLEEERRSRLAEGASGPRLAALEKELRGLLAERSRLRAASLPGAGQVPEPLAAREIQREVLDEGTLLLEYALGDERSFLWLVDRNRVVPHVLPGRAEIERQARWTHDLLSRSQRRGIRRQASLAAAALSEMVLGPVAAELGDRRLLIVADGALQAVPFAALPVPAGGGPRAAGEPLLVHHEIVHLPSASALAFLRRRLAGRPPAPDGILVVADPVFRADDPRVGRAQQGGGYPRLAGSREEAAAILRLVPSGQGSGLFGFAAGREALLGEPLSRFRLLHFATHSLLDEAHPELSGIALTLVDEQGRARDGFLRAHEIADQELRADLVVLSACRTALGKEVRGEGLMGLPHSFLGAGAARVVVSLWNVDDAATAELMARFYRALLRDGAPPGLALRAAQLSVSREERWRAPYYWGGFVLQGEWRSSEHFRIFSVSRQQTRQMPQGGRDGKSEERPARGAQQDDGDRQEADPRVDATVER